MEEEVHLADGPGRTLVVLTVQRKVVHIAAVFTHMLTGVDEHTAGTAAGVIDALPLLGIDQADHEADHISGGVELASFL